MILSNMKKFRFVQIWKFVFLIHELRRLAIPKKKRDEHLYRIFSIVFFCLFFCFVFHPFIWDLIVILYGLIFWFVIHKACLPEFPVDTFDHFTSNWSLYDYPFIIISHWLFTPSDIDPCVTIDLDWFHCVCCEYVQTCKGRTPPM